MYAHACAHSNLYTNVATHPIDALEVAEAAIIFDNSTERERVSTRNSKKSAHHQIPKTPPTTKIPKSTRHQNVPHSKATQITFER